MTWRIEWGGRATDFTPELLHTEGKPGPGAQMAVDLLWEGVQRVGERSPSAWVRVTAKGSEDPDKPGDGHFALDFHVLGEEPSQIQQALEGQQPLDLNKASGAAWPSARRPESPASEAGDL